MIASTDGAPGPASFKAGDGAGRPVTMAEALAGPSGEWRLALDGFGREVSILPLAIHALPPPAAGVECRAYVIMAAVAPTPDGIPEGDAHGQGTPVDGAGIACRSSSGRWRVVADAAARAVLDRKDLTAVRALAPLAVATLADAAGLWPDGKEAPAQA